MQGYQKHGLARTEASCPAWSIWGAGTDHGCINHAYKSSKTTTEHNRFIHCKRCCSQLNDRTSIFLNIKLSEYIIYL